MKLALFLLAVPLLAQESRSDKLARFVGTVKRVTNPPQNVFVIQTKGIAEMGRPLCIASVIVRAQLQSGDRNSEGEERFIEKTYTLELMEQHNGITRPRSVDLGRGRLLAMEVEATPLLNDFNCGTLKD